MRNGIKKAIVLLLCLVTVLSMSIGITFATEQGALGEGAAEASIVITDASGVEHTVTETQMKAATKVEVSAESPWNYYQNETAKTAYGTFYSFKSILENAEIDYSDAHGVKLVASDGFTTGYTTAQVDDLYIYDMAEVTKNGSIAGAAGTFGTAINGSAGNKWANDIVSGAVAESHIWFVKKGACKHYCAICGDNEPSITISYNDGTQDITATIYECEIKAGTKVEVSQNDPWHYNETSGAYGTFYSLKNILENKGIDYSTAHGVKLVASDGFTTGYTTAQVDDLYIYDMAEVTKNGSVAGSAGTFGTAINGSAGNKWANDVVSGAVAESHVWFVKKGACKHYCAICGEYEKVESTEWTWTAYDSAKITVTYECGGTATGDATITSEVIKEAKCENCPGETEYTATATVNGISYTDKNIDKTSPATTGHRWVTKSIDKEHGKITLECSYCKTTKVEDYSEEAEKETEIVVKTVIDEPTADMKANGITSQDAIVKKLSNTISDVSGFKQSDSVCLELELLVKIGDEWVVATKDIFPKEGITVSISYEDLGFDKNSDFIVAHMFKETMIGADGVKHEAGDVEIINNIKKTDTGIEFTVYSLSPFEIAAGTVTATKAGTDTGDTNDILPYALIMLIAMAGAGAVAYKRRNY